MHDKRDGFISANTLRQSHQGSSHVGRRCARRFGFDKGQFSLAKWNDKIDFESLLVAKVIERDGEETSNDSKEGCYSTYMFI